MEVCWNFFRQIFYIPRFKKEILARVPAAFFFSLVNFFFKLAPKKCFFLGYLVAKFRNCLKFCQILLAFPVASQNICSSKGDEILLPSSYFVYSQIGLNPLMGWSPLTTGELVFGEFSPLWGTKKLVKSPNFPNHKTGFKSLKKKKLLLTPATSQNGKNKSLRLWPSSPFTGFL
jgi:hypothetical protein